MTMDARKDAAVWNAWYVVGSPMDIRRQNRTHTFLLGREIELTIHKTRISAACEGRRLPVTERLGYVWVTLGDPDGWPQPLLEYYEVDRIVMNIWSTPLKCSGLRIVDNVVDNAHYPFVHPGILGDEQHLDLVVPKPYEDNSGSLISPSHKAYLPITGEVQEYSYHVSDPYSVVLSIHLRDTPDRANYLGIFAQPLDEENFVAHKLLAWVQEDWMDARQLASDQQWISVQDKYVLERHTEKKLPLTEQEASVSVDVASLAYRQWLRNKGVRYGAIT